MANLRFRTLPRFPARLLATGGFKITKAGADWTVEPDWGLLSVLTSIADIANTEVWVRVTSAGVSTYFRMTVQAFLSAQGAFYYNFDVTTTDSDPGPGVLRLNQAVQNTATVIRADLLDTGGGDRTSELDTFDDSTSTVKGTIRLSKVGDPSKWLTFSVASVASPAGYRNITVTVTGSSSASPFQTGELILLRFDRNGDAGAMGGSAGATDNAVLRADGVGGATLQNSLVIISDAGAVTGVTSLTGSGDFNTTAGKVKENSVDISPIGKHTIWIPAGAMVARATNGAGAATFDSGSNDITIKVFDFDQTTSEFVQWQIAMPKGWDEGTVTFIPYWTADAGTATQTVSFLLQAVAISNDDVMNAAMGSSVASIDALIATGDLHVGPESSAITIGGTPAEGDLICFQLFRDIADTLAADARLIGVKIIYTINAATDN